MELTERKRREADESFNKEAEEAKLTLIAKEKEIKARQDQHFRTLTQVREKCHEQFETQRQIYNKFNEIKEAQLLHRSEVVVKKYQMTQRKTKDLKERTATSVEEHRQKNYERFYLRDEGLDRKKEERDQFLKKEAQRHNSRIKAREVILSNISIDGMQKKERRQLRVADALFNLEMERKKKQESQDFWLKKEFVKNAFN